MFDMAGSEMLGSAKRQRVTYAAVCGRTPAQGYFVRLRRRARIESSRTQALVEHMDLIGT